MNREQARQLIKDTFEATFNKEKFIIFIKDLLNKIEESTFAYRGNFIPDAFEQYISTLERIGKYTDDENEIDLLIVKLKKKAFLERARTMQRNFIAWYLKGSRGGKLKDAALVAFVSPDEENWRFSLVKMDYRFEEGKAGRVKVKEEFTPARRWSFLVGKNEKSHTAQSRIVPILEDDEHNPTLTQLEEAFNIETVTKEFFKKYRDLFIRTVDELDKIVKKDEKVRKNFELKNINTIDFTKKLLGQIVFLYFLQKKGWFGVKRDAEWGTGPKKFLRQLFEKKYGDYKNFFNNILEPLFYEALARERDDDFYSRFNCKIPFLNGGLFEPIGGYDWVHTDMILQHELFANNNRTQEGDEGDGILDVFDRFNFTVKEDEPLEKEVAIDPELLGKLYEKFNAIRPDNFYEYKRTLVSGKRNLEKQFNKKFGVYYTPREIVHYMCQESLINYLHTSVNQELMKLPAKTSRQIKLIGTENPEQISFQTDEEIVSKDDIQMLIKYGEQFAENEAVVEEKGQETKTYKHKLPKTIRENAKLIDEKLRDIKICDPAVGSGAFPVGMMSEIVKARNVLTTFLLLQGKEVTKESHTGDHFAYAHDDNRTIYNFKRDCIKNSLYGVDIDPGACEIAKLRLWLSLIVDEEDIRQIKPLPNLDYKIMQGNSLISEFLGINFDIDKDQQSETLKFESEIDPLIKQFQEKKNKFLNEPDRNKKEHLKQEIESLIAEIFEEKLKKQSSQYFSQLKSIEEKYSILPNEEQQNKYIAEEKEKLYKEKGFNLEQVEQQLKEYTSGRKIRPFFPWKLYFAEVFQGKGGFDVVIENPPYVSYGLRGGQKMTEHEKGFLRKNFPNSAEYKISLYAIFMDKAIQIARLDDGIQTLIVPDSFLLGRYFSKIRNLILKNNEIDSILLLPYSVFDSTVGFSVVYCFQRKTVIDNRHLVSARFAKNKEQISKVDFNHLNYLQYYFERTKYKRFRLFFDKKIMDLVLKIENRTNELLNYMRGHTGVRSLIGQKNIIAKELKTKTWQKGLISGSQVLKYKISYDNDFINIDPKVLNKGGWDYKIIHNPKIFLRQTGDSLIATVDYDGYYHLNNLHSFSTINNKLDILFILSLLNSSLFDFYYKSISLEMNRTMAQTDIETIESLPIKEASKQEQKLFIDLVDKILAITKTDDYLENPEKQAKVKEYECQIDQLVYKLYDLTPKEIEIIETFSRR